MQRCKSFPNSNRHNRTVNRTKKSTGAKTEVLQLHDNPLPVLIEEHKEAIGIITMEDIIEEIIQVNLVSFTLFLFKDEMERVHFYKEVLDVPIHVPSYIPELFEFIQVVILKDKLLKSWK